MNTKVTSINQTYSSNEVEQWGYILKDMVLNASLYRVEDIDEAITMYHAAKLCQTIDQSIFEEFNKAKL